MSKRKRGNNGKKPYRKGYSYGYEKHRKYAGGKKFRAGYSRTGGFYGRFSGTGMGQELKFHDITIDDALIATTGTIQNAGSINLIPQGVTEITRIGRKCTIRNILWRLRLTIVNTADAAVTGDTARVILYLDKQCNGATIAVTDLLETADEQSFNNLANSGRFRVLMDRTYDMNCTSGSGRGSTDTLAFGENVVNDTFFKKCNIPLEFSSTTGAITEIRSNNLGVLLISQDGNATNFESNLRLRFSDS